MSVSHEFQLILEQRNTRCARGDGSLDRHWKNCVSFVDRVLGFTLDPHTHIHTVYVHTYMIFSRPGLRRSRSTMHIMTHEFGMLHFLTHREKYVEDSLRHFNDEKHFKMTLSRSIVWHFYNCSFY